MYSNYVLALIDVLGQKELFQGFDDSFLTVVDDPRLVAIHKNTVMAVEELRGILEGFLKTFTENGVSEEVISRIPPDKVDQFREMRKTEVITYRFSDCILAYSSLQKTKYCSPAMNSVYGILMACGIMMTLSLARKKVFRAAVDIGLGTLLSNGEVYGPVSYKVYKMESSIAQYPRIVIGDNLHAYLTSLSHETKQFEGQTAEDIKLCKEEAGICLKMIVRDLDGYPILDYLGDTFKNCLGDGYNHPDGSIKEEEILNKAMYFIREEYDKKRKMKDSKLALRYFLLLNYFKARIPKKNI